MFVWRDNTRVKLGIGCTKNQLTLTALHKDSNHHPAQKRGILENLSHRAKCIWEPEHLPQVLRHLKAAFQAKGYLFVQIQPGRQNSFRVMYPFYTWNISLIALATCCLQRIRNLLLPKIKDHLSESRSTGFHAHAVQSLGELLPPMALSMSYQYLNDWKKLQTLKHLRKSSSIYFTFWRYNVAYRRTIEVKNRGDDWQKGQQVALWLPH